MYFLNSIQKINFEKNHIKLRKNKQNRKLPYFLTQCPLIRFGPNGPRTDIWYFEILPGMRHY
jgi:hypothetical protein